MHYPHQVRFVLLSSLALVACQAAPQGSERGAKAPGASASEAVGQGGRTAGSASVPGAAELPKNPQGNDRGGSEPDLRHAAEPSVESPEEAGLVLGELAPYGLESGRAPRVAGPSGGSTPPRADTTQLASRIARLRGRFRNCYSRALQTDPGLNGRVAFRIEVSPSGKVKSVSVDREQTSESLLKGQLTTCLLSAIRSADFGSTGRSTPVTFSLPMEIRSPPSKESP